jgi:hypothetical protein
MHKIEPITSLGEAGLCSACTDWPASRYCPINRIACMDIGRQSLVDRAGSHPRYSHWRTAGLLQEARADLQ